MSLTRIGSIGINTGIAFAGVTTIVTLNTANDALSIGSTVNVGSGITLGASGDIFATGVSTVTTLKVGSGVTVSSDGDVFFTGIATGNASGLTALNASNISSGTVPTARLGSGTASSSTFLRGDSTFQTVSTDLVDDTTPQLGGNLDVNTKNIVFGDSGSASDDRLTFGAGTDLSIYHDGTHSYVVNTVGNLRIQNNGTVKTAQFEVDTIDFNDSANSEVRVRINSDGLSLVQDNDKVQIGASQDLSLYHDGTNSYIASNQGELRLTGANGTIRIRPTTAEDSIVAAPNAGVELYHDNTLKFGTDSAGVYARGDMMLNYADDYKIKMGAGNDFQLYHDGSYNYILSPNAHPLIQESDEIQLRAVNNEKYFRGVVNGAVELYHDNTLKLYTVTQGVRIERSGSSNYLVVNAAYGGGAVQALEASGALEIYASSAKRVRFDSDGGIKFGSDTAAANALDGYEEGTFTATCANSVTLHSGGDKLAYTKIGRVVTVRGQIAINSDNGNADLIINNLPFANVNTDEDSDLNVGACRIWSIDVPSGTLDVVCMINSNDTNLQFWRNKDAAGGERLDADGGGYVGFSITYFTSS